jgi:hypothetical protein
MCLSPSPDLSLLRFSDLKPCLSSFLLLDGSENFGCALLGHMHIYVLRINFCEFEKDREGRCQTIRESFFLFFQKIKDGKAG